MKKTLILAIAVSLLFAGIAFGAGVVSSKHDMRLEDNTNQGSSTAVCEFCHHPHRGPGSVAAGFGTTDMLLWNRNYSTATTYLPYGNTATLNGIPASIVMTTVSATNYATALCMSCHDGANANNSMIRAPRNGSVTLNLVLGTANLGSTLADDHPVNFQYTTENMGDDIPAPGTATWSTYPLYGGYFQCATCHDVHKGTSPVVQFMRGNVGDSAICIACHTAK